MIINVLCQVYIVLKDDILFQRDYAKGLDASLFSSILPKIKQDTFSKFGGEMGEYDFYRYKLSFIVDKDYDLMIIFVSGLTDNFDRIKVELHNLKKEFIDSYRPALKKGLDILISEDIEPILDKIHMNLSPKISIIGYAGVGKTTITKLIKEEEIPMEHIPTINGNHAVVKLGKLYLSVWDFAGQEQFSFLWKKFIAESDAVLLITDSSFENMEKSRYFIDLINEVVPYSHSAVIGNKQDLPTSIDIESIERVMGLKAYPMIATDRENKVKMIRIIAELLEIDPDVSPLLRPLIEKEELILKVENALESNNIEQALSYYKKIHELCIEIGDNSLAAEYQEKTENLKNMIKQQMSIQCTKCGRFVARSKAKADTRRTNLVDSRMYGELKKAGTIIMGAQNKKYYCISCAVHGHQISQRAKKERKSTL